MTVITFDFDNTIAMSQMKFHGKNPKIVFEGYNNAILNLMMNYINDGHDVHIVTARDRDKEGLFPNDTIEKHLDKLELKDYFWPDKVHYTNDSPKRQKLEELGSMLHYDDNLQEHLDNFGGIKVINPYSYYKDTKFVGKVVLFDANDKVLLLRRTDEGKKWDIPGGHLKDIEVNRGETGYEDGLEREVLEETGILLPFSKKIGDSGFYHKGKESRIAMYVSKLEESEPEVNLNMQDFQENSEYKWIAMDEMFKYVKNGTMVMKKAIELAKNHGILTEESRFQLSQKKKHSKMKKRLVGMGKNRHFGGGKGHKRPKMSRSKSAPAGFGVLEEENEVKSKKIRVKIVDNIDEKRKKRRKKRKKTHKKRAKYAYYGGYLPHKSEDYGSNGGDGGGGE
jgi:8-oxo-dGTP pyrophosphatase MutT (NUDIX family)